MRESLVIGGAGTMIGHDNPLTVGDKPSTRDAPSFPSGDLRIFLAALERLGYKPASLLSATGLSPALLDDPDARVPCQAFGAVIGEALRIRPMKNLGVRIAAETPIGAFALLDYLVVTSNNVGEALQQLVRYFRITSTPIGLEILEEENPIRLVVRTDNPVSAEFSVALDVLHLREESNGSFSPEWASFAHNLDDADQVQRILGCPVRTGASWSGLAISRAAWQLPFRRRDPVLRKLLERQADEMIAQTSPADDSVLTVRRLLAKRISGGDTRIESIANELATTPRTLQRKLEAASTSYQELVEQIRREAAEKYLMNLSVSIAEVAFLLGYSEPSAFHRAFKRWSGMTPQSFRERRPSPLRAN